MLWEPRVDISYRIAPSNTVLRLGYSKTLETPLNENLVLSSETGQGGLTKTSSEPKGALLFKQADATSSLPVSNREWAAFSC